MTKASVVLVHGAWADGSSWQKVVAGLGEVGSERVQGVVYVAALAPDEGETVVSNYVRGEPHPQEQQVLYASQRPISPACITVPVQRPLWRDRPSWYLVAEDDRMIARENQRFMAQRMKATVRSIAAGHAPGVTAAAAVVALILEAVAHHTA